MNEDQETKTQGPKQPSSQIPKDPSTQRPNVRLGVMDYTTVRCRWCEGRIGHARYFQNGRAVAEPVLHGLLSDTICPECALEFEAASAAA